jgi:hypothetical protein
MTKRLESIDKTIEFTMRIRGYLDQASSNAKAASPPSGSPEAVLIMLIRNLAEQSPGAGMAEGDPINAWGQLLDQEIRTLQSNRHEIATDPSLVRASTPNLGRPRLIWMEEFVDEMATLWRLLTLEERTYSDDSYFGRFVQAAWESLDEEMPEVSFSRAIRKRT